MGPFQIVNVDIYIFVTGPATDMVSGPATDMVSSTLTTCARKDCPKPNDTLYIVVICILAALCLFLGVLVLIMAAAVYRPLRDLIKG